MELQQRQQSLTMAVDLAEVSFPAWPPPLAAVNALDDTLVSIVARLRRATALTGLLRLVLVPVAVAVGAVLTLFALLFATLLAPLVAIALASFAAWHDRAVAVGIGARAEPAAPAMVLLRLVAVPAVVALGAVLTLFTFLCVTVLAPLLPIGLAWFAAWHDRRADAVAGTIGALRVPAIGS